MRHTDHSLIPDSKGQIKSFTWDQNGRDHRGVEEEIVVLDMIPVPERLELKIKVTNREQLTFQCPNPSRCYFLWN